MLRAKFPNYEFISGPNCNIGDLWCYETAITMFCNDPCNETQRYLTETHSRLVENLEKEGVAIPKYNQAMFWNAIADLRDDVC